MYKDRLALVSILIFFLSTHHLFAQQVSLGHGEFKISFPFGKKYDYNHIKVARVIDGDTVELENGERIRIIGIDAPEIYESNKLYAEAQKRGQNIKTIQERGRKAKDFTKYLCEGKNVRLEFDIEKRDKYGHLLAYIYLQDGTFVNAEIVKQGFANLMTIAPNIRYADLFQRLYQEAKDNKRGLWQE